MIKQSHPNSYKNKGDSSDTRTDPNRVRFWSQSHQHAKDTDADKERGPLGESMGSFVGGHKGNGLSTPNVEGQPRGDCGRAVFSNDKAGWGGLALSESAGPIPALRCGDWLGLVFIV